jgi:predicted aconitase
MTFYTDLKSMFAKACITSSCNPAPVDGVDLAEIKKKFQKKKKKNAIAKVCSQIKLHYGYVFVPITRFI